MSSTRILYKKKMSLCGAAAAAAAAANRGKEVDGEAWGRQSQSAKMARLFLKK